MRSSAPKQRSFTLPDGTKVLGKRATRVKAAGHAHLIYLPKWLINNGVKDAEGYFWVSIRHVDPLTFEVRILREGVLEGEGESESTEPQQGTFDVDNP